MEEQPVWAVLPPSTAAEAIPALLPSATRLAESFKAPLEAVIFGEPADDLRRALAAQGAGRVYGIPLPDASRTPQGAAVLARLAAERRPRVLLLPDGPKSRELAARVAARLDAGLAIGCRQVEAATEGIRAVRSAYGGRASCTVVIASRPALLTLEPSSTVSSPRARAADCEFVPVPVPGPAPPAPAVLEVRPVDPFEMELEEAQVIVAGGAGVGGPEGFALLGELARRLRGAVGASRLAVDAGWAPYHRQIGQSGRVVAPRLYIACGISGAVHHLVGVRDAETVVAINTDPHAPVVGRAELALVGDVRAVVGALIDRLEAGGNGPTGWEPASPAAALGGFPRGVT